MSSVGQDDAKNVPVMGGYKVKLIWPSDAMRFKLLRHCILTPGVGIAGGAQKTRVSLFVGRLLKNV